jgi:hypothetical protein
VIVLDEHLGAKLVLNVLRSKYRGTVKYVQELRPGTTIKDEAIPALLLQQKKPVFVTINESDFWRKIQAHRGYCVICFAWPTDRQAEIPDLLAKLFRHPEFRTSAKQMGKVIRVSGKGIQYYDVTNRSPRKLTWAPA